MDNSTEYCSFVSVDYIICECGETFPNEDALKIHLDNEHATVKSEKFEDFVDTNNEESFMDEGQIDEDMPSVITEKLPDADVQTSLVYLFDSHIVQPHGEFYLENASQAQNIQFLLPEEIKQEEIVIQYVDQEGTFITSVEEIEEPQITVSTPSTPPYKQVTFKKEQLSDEVVILAQANDEHDYDREAVKPEKHDYFFCDVCGKSFLTERSVNMHMTRMHGVETNKTSKNKNKNKKNSVCDVCGKKYAMWERKCTGCDTKRPLSKQTLNVKRVTCETCGVSRCSNAALRYHQRVHTGERPYQCTECDKTFTMPLFLQLHLRTHTGERPYQCPHCPKAFSNQAALVRHDRVHTGVKPYACPECGKAFTQSNSMKLHYQTVHLRMPAPYKSAARKLRDLQKVVLLQETSRKVRKSQGKSSREPAPYIVPEDKIVFLQESSRKLQRASSSSEYIVPHEKLLFRHGKYLANRPQYEYVVEEVSYDNDDYGEDYIVQHSG